MCMARERLRAGCVCRGRMVDGGQRLCSCLMQDGKVDHVKVCCNSMLWQGGGGYCCCCCYQLELSWWYWRGLLLDKRSEKNKLENWLCRSKGDGRCGGVIPQKVVSAV